MQKIQKIFKALSMKGAIDVYMLVYGGCQTEYYTNFNDLLRMTGFKTDTLRRITNNLSRAKLIKSVKFGTGRERYYIVYEKETANMIYMLLSEI